MGQSLNRVELIGYLGGDPFYMYVPSGLLIGAFWLVNGETWQDHDGHMQADAEWHRIIVWGQLVEDRIVNLRRGDLIYLEGRLTARFPEQDDELQHYLTEIVAQRVILLNTKPASRAQADKAALLKSKRPEMRVDDGLPLVPDAITQRDLSREG